MGLTNASTGLNAVDSVLEIKRQSSNDRVIAIAGNPNVGKSTLFNNLTGMHQHTGNWPGKTVANAQGRCKTQNHTHILVDIPGTYSLMANSAEEEVARNFICFEKPDATVVVCDATCLERNLNLVLQIIEMSPKVLVCVNLLDEAKRKHIKVNLSLLSERLGVPVVGTVARNKKSSKALTTALDKLIDGETSLNPVQVNYGAEIEQALTILIPTVEKKLGGKLNARWLSVKLLDGDPALLTEINTHLDFDLFSDAELLQTVDKAKELIPYDVTDKLVCSFVKSAEQICDGVVTFTGDNYKASDLKIDKFLTSRAVGYPVMIIMLLLVFWLTITASNYPSELLSRAFAILSDGLSELFVRVNAPIWLHGALIDGVYNVLTSVIAVMLPPMAIFFPLFTLLEDSGYLPRVAYNLDKPFRRCKTCGKQALTMCMGFGCNAAGVTGCRIIDSPRERLIAILTNSFVPCNGRFPALITLITIFLVGTSGGVADSFVSALLLTLLILLSLIVTFFVSRILSETFLKGVPSSFALELPPYRKPQIGKVIVRSVFDRTLFVLGRAAAVAAPAGLVIWLMANVTVGDITLLQTCANILDPLGKALGMDGTILIAFILGFPANEIVIPIILMTYMATGTLTDVTDLSQMYEVFTQNGWTVTTAVCTMLFSVFHFPCSTTVITVYKETKRIKWTVLAFLLPTVIGMLLCFAVATVSRII